MKYELTSRDLSVLDNADPEAVRIVFDMLSTLWSAGVLPHSRAVRLIRENHGEKYLRRTEAGNVGIDRRITRLMHRAALFSIGWNGKKQLWWVKSR